jgi:hypothetical protein
MKLRTILLSIKSKLGYLAIGIVLAVYLIHMFNVKYWNINRGIIFWDTISYYAYLPATFIYHDLSLKFIDEDPAFFNDKIWPQRAENNNYVIKTSMGLSILYSPFFFAAHLFAKCTDYEANGYSLPYHISLAFSSFFYIIFGFFFLYKILIKFFKQWTIFFTILSIGIATNLFAYTTGSPTMAHSFNFTLIILFTYLCILWYEHKNIKYSVFIGLTGGLILLIRPTNIVVVFIFLLYNISSFKTIKSRFIEWKENWYYILLIIFLAILVWVPQFIYWKTFTNHWLYFSYNDNEGFFWTEPMFLKGWFGFRKGLFIYTPVLLLSVAGFFFLKKGAKEFTFVVPLVFIVASYIILSWWTWWYGGGFGGRPFIDFYGLMAIPLAALLSSIPDFKRWLKLSVSILFLLSFFLGIFNYVKSYYGAIHYDAMTWKAYKHSFFQIRSDEEMESLLVHPDYEKSKLERVRD